MHARARSTLSLKLERLFSAWVVRSLMFGGVAAAVDYTVVWTTSSALELRAAFAALSGLTVGATVNFLLNRRFAFADSPTRTSGAAIRYFAAFGCLMIVHATAVGLLVDTFGLQVLLAKLVADVTLLLGGQLLVLRYVVFPRNKKAVAAVTAQRAAEPMQSP